MRVIQIGSTYYATAQGVLEHELQNELLRHGDESYVCYADDYGIPYPGYSDSGYRFYSSLDWTFSKIIRRMGLPSIIFNFLPTVKLIRYIKIKNPDIIHLHVIHHQNFNVNLLFRFIAKNQYSVVFTMHDFWFMTGGCYHFYKRGCTQYLHGCKNCKASGLEIECNKKFSHNQLLKKEKFYSALLNAKFVTVSEWMKTVMKGSIIPEERICTIYNGVDTNIFTASDIERVSKNKKRIVSVASFWSNSKGLNRFLSLANKFSDEFEIMLVGDYAHSKDCPTNIIFTGAVMDKRKLADLYRNSDVFLSLSLEETFGLVVAEASCCGIPVVGYNTTGIAEVIKRANGELLEVDDSDDVIITKIEHAINNYNQRNIDIARDIFDIRNTRQKYYAIYQAVAQPKAR